MTDQPMTPREAAYRVTKWGERDGAAMQVLVDHALATSPAPEGGDLAAHAATVRSVVAELTGTFLGTSGTCRALGKKLLPVSQAMDQHTCAPAPSVAPPRPSSFDDPCTSDAACEAGQACEHHAPLHAPAVPQTEGEGSGRRVTVCCDDEDLLDEVVLVAAAAGCELERVGDAAALRLRWSSAAMVLLDEAAARAAAGVRLARRDGVVVLCRGDPPGSIWERAVAVGAEHVVSLPEGEAWLVSALSRTVRNRVA